MIDVAREEGGEMDEVEFDEEDVDGVREIGAMGYSS